MTAPMPIVKKFCSRRCSKAASKKKHKRNDKQRLRYALSSRMRELLQKRGLQKKNSCLAYLGMTGPQFFSYIESLFEPGMAWDNYGVFGWHLDHAIPCAAFDMSREDHLMLCFNWRNMKPMWHKENNRKADVITVSDMAFVGAEFIEEALKLGVTIFAKL
jgi:hypothetical protein